MNDRIRELLKQAGVGDNWNKADWYNMSPEMIEKFAELIVTECANVADDNYIHRGSRTCGLAIRLHFGVEE